MTADLLSDRALNRATLDRQLLLRRSALRPVEAVEHLVGLQAQNPLDPYLGLWSRLDAFDPDALGALLSSRDLVRIVVMRGTVHLVTAADALRLRPLMQPVLDAEIARHPDFAPHLVGVDIQSVLEFAYQLLADKPMSGRQLRAAMAERFPDLHAPALAYACRCHLPLVQVPPRGVWGKTMQVTSTPVQAWVGRALERSPSIDEVVLRYLNAFGPATVADVAAWSRLTGQSEVLERLRRRLRTFRDERGRELFDLPDGVRPDPETPAPIRFLPQYDNVLLSHADRTRFGMDGASHLARATGPAKGSVLVDGLVKGIWRFERDSGRRSDPEEVVLIVEHFGLTDALVAATELEAQQVLHFWHPDAAIRSVRLIPLS